jgi:hypothetical protein
MEHARRAETAQGACLYSKILNGTLEGGATLSVHPSHHMSGLAPPLSVFLTAGPCTRSARQTASQREEWELTSGDNGTNKRHYADELHKRPDAQHMQTTSNDSHATRVRN